MLGHRRTNLIAAAAGLLSALPAGAQDAGPQQQARRDRIEQLEEIRRDTRLRVNADIPPGQRLFFDYGAYLQASYLSVDDSVGDGHVLRQYDFLPYARLNIDGVHEFFVRGRFGYQDYNDGDSFTGRGDEPIDGDLDRAYYRFDLRRYASAYGKSDPGKLTLQLGRDFVYWGNGLVLAQTLDGGMVTVGTDLLELTLLAGVTPTRTVDIDTSRPAFDYNTRRGFFGAMLTADLGDHRPYVYVLSQRDFNSEDFRSVSFIDTRYNYNSVYLGAGSSGAIGPRIRYGVEAVAEFGTSKSNSFSIDGFGLFPVDQTSDRIHAYAVNARLDYFVEDPGQTRLSAEFTLATGDGDRGTTTNTFNGNQPDTDDTAFNAFGLINTGLAFAPSASNLMALRLGAATLPLPETAATRRLQIGTDVFFFAKHNRDAPIEENTGDVRYLGWEPDVYLNWQATSDITIALRYGIFFPNDDNFAFDDNRQFFYGGITFAL